MLLSKLARIVRFPAARPTFAKWTGSWVDERGSRMDLICRGRRVDGSYHAIFNELQGREMFPLTGYFQENLISFTVHFFGHGSLACWVGELGEDERGATVLRTAWLLTERLKSGKKRAAALSGNNEFRRLRI